uniref:Uncharacterized protein n=1 Tax=Ditylenchus dipsaci TaxID=166011 RepID=A0A915DGK0_9BILA
MAMPQQWWQQQQPGSNPQQQQIPPSSMVDENPGKTVEKSGLPPPPPVIFFPMGQGQAQNGQPQPFPAFAKEVMGGGQQRKDFGVQQQLQFPVFKNFIPQRTASKWNHLNRIFLASQKPQWEEQSDSDSNSQENVTPAQTTDELAAANQDSKSSSSGSSEQQQPQQASGNNKDSDDVWLVAPPHRTQPPPQPHMVDASTDDSSAPTPSSLIHPPAFSPPKEPPAMTTHRLSTASFIEPDQAVSFTSFAHISKQLPIKLSFTKNHQKPLPPPTLPPRLNLSSQNLVYHPLIAVEDNYSELIESNSHLEPLPSQIYRTDSEASIISGSSNHLDEVEEKGQGLTNLTQISTKAAEIPTNFGKETTETASNSLNFGSEKEKV